jgi:dipeptidase E
MRDMIIASTSTLHGEDYLQYLLPVILKAFEERQVSELLFIPYARPGGISHEQYTARVAKVMISSNINVKGLHEFSDPVQAIENATAIFTGGGNTFVLVKTLHEHALMPILRKKIYDGVLYIGTSAGSNICGLNMCTTNDMPIVMPSSFKTTGAIGYNINAHYLDPVSASEHMGETREQRIREYHTYNSVPVVGLREGSYIRVQGANEILRGPYNARIFRKDQPAVELEPDTNLNQIH